MIFPMAVKKGIEKRVLCCTRIKMPKAVNDISNIYVVKKLIIESY